MVFFPLFNNKSVLLMTAASLMRPVSLAGALDVAPAAAAAKNGSRSEAFTAAWPTLPKISSSSSSSSSASAAVAAAGADSKDNEKPKLMGAIDIFRAEMCGHQGFDSGEYDKCFKFMVEHCRPGKDQIMDGDEGERTTGEGFCTEFFNRFTEEDCGTFDDGTTCPAIKCEWDGKKCHLKADDNSQETKHKNDEAHSHLDSHAAGNGTSSASSPHAVHPHGASSASHPRGAESNTHIKDHEAPINRDLDHMESDWARDSNPPNMSDGFEHMDRDRLGETDEAKEKRVLPEAKPKRIGAWDMYPSTTTTTTTTTASAASRSILASSVVALVLALGAQAAA